LKIIQLAASDKLSISRDRCPSLRPLRSHSDSLRRFPSETAQLCSLTRMTEESARHSDGSRGDSAATITELDIAKQIQRGTVLRSTIRSAVPQRAVVAASRGR
jgi:hypothetical protein